MDKNHRAITSRLLVAIDQPFREQSVKPKAERGVSSRLSADEFWPAPSEQSLPGAHSDTPRPSSQATDTAGVSSVGTLVGNAKHLLVLACMITKDNNLSATNTATGSFVQLHLRRKPERASPIRQTGPPTAGVQRNFGPARFIAFTSTSANQAAPQGTPAGSTPSRQGYTPYHSRSVSARASRHRSP